MSKRQFEKMLLPVAASGVILVAGLLVTSPRGLAQSATASSDSARVAQGYAIAPVNLNTAGKDYNLVGLGSYLVNAVGDCNGCHSSNSQPLFLYPYVTGRNPYFDQPKKIDASVYLAGGQSFGTVGTPTGPSGYGGPTIITRNFDAGQDWKAGRRSHACRV